MDVPFEKKFHFRDGATFGSLEELKTKLEHISYQEFYHHVNSQKNDFANWVRYVIKDERLADDLLKVTSIVETVEIINDFIHPMPITTPRIDTQSRIEQSIFSAPMPAETNEAMPVEAVVSVTAASAAKTGKEEALEFKIIEEKIDALSTEEAAAKLAMSPIASEELFGQETKAKEQLASEQHAMQVSREKAGENVHDTRMIVKDFMYGLLFGLIIGLILGKILSF